LLQNNVLALCTVLPQDRTFFALAGQVLSRQLSAVSFQ